MREGLALFRSSALTLLMAAVTTLRFCTPYPTTMTSSRSVQLSSISILISELLTTRSEEHTSELQSRPHLVCRLLLEKKKKKANITSFNNIEIFVFTIIEQL